MSKTVKREAQINLRVVPEVKRVWEKLPEPKRKLLIRKFQMDVLGIAYGDDLPEELAQLPLTLKYDIESLKALKEVFEAVLPESEWVNKVKKFLKAFVEMHSTAICEYGGLPKLKAKALELLEEAP